MVGGVLFLRKFFTAKDYPVTITLGRTFRGRTSILAPSLPLRPGRTLGRMHSVVRRRSPSLLLNGDYKSFLTRVLTPVINVPTLLNGPRFRVAGFLGREVNRRRCGTPHGSNGRAFVVSRTLVRRFTGLRGVRFSYYGPCCESHI